MLVLVGAHQRTLVDHLRGQVVLVEVMSGIGHAVTRAPVALGLDEVLQEQFLGELAPAPLDGIVHRPVLVQEQARQVLDEVPAETLGIQGRQSVSPGSLHSAETAEVRETHSSVRFIREYTDYISSDAFPAVPEVLIVRQLDEPVRRLTGHRVQVGVAIVGVVLRRFFHVEGQDGVARGRQGFLHGMHPLRPGERRAVQSAHECRGKGVRQRKGSVQWKDVKFHMVQAEGRIHRDISPGGA